jgi:hypothetical protein
MYPFIPNLLPVPGFGSGFLFEEVFVDVDAIGKTDGYVYDP